MYVNVLLSILMLVALILPGFILRKFKMVFKVSVSSLVAILLYVNQPFLIIKSFLYDSSNGLDPYDGNFLLCLLYVFLISIAAQLLLFFVMKLCMRKVRPVEKSRAYTFAGIFGNIGFIGIPFIAGVMADSPQLPAALIYCTVFNVTFNMLMWTVGVYIITGDPKSMRPLKMILNPSVLALVVALPLFFLKIDLHATLAGKTAAKFIGFIGDMTTPVAMFIVGIRLADMNIKEIFTDVWAWVCSAVKLVAAPLIMTGIVLLLRLTGMFGTGEIYESYGKAALTVLIALSALPSAASTIAFTEKYRGDTQTALKGFMNSTLLSAALLPLILMLLLSLL